MNKLFTFLLFIAIGTSCTSDDALTSNERLISTTTGVVLSKRVEQGVGYFIKVKYLYDPGVAELKAKELAGDITCAELAALLKARDNDPSAVLKEAINEFPSVPVEYEKINVGDTYKLPPRELGCSNAIYPPSWTGY